MRKKKDKKDWIRIRLYSYVFMTKYVRRKYCYIRIYAYVDIIKMLEKLGQSYSEKYEILIYGKRKSHHPEIVDPGRIVSIERERNTRIQRFTIFTFLMSYIPRMIFWNSRHSFVDLESVSLYLSTSLSPLFLYSHLFIHFYYYLVIIIYRCNF